jgi:hypothetical protein
MKPSGLPGASSAPAPGCGRAGGDRQTTDSRVNRGIDVSIENCFHNGFDSSFLADQPEGLWQPFEHKPGLHGLIFPNPHRQIRKIAEIEENQLLYF